MGGQASKEQPAPMPVLEAASVVLPSHAIADWDDAASMYTVFSAAPASVAPADDLAAADARGSPQASARRGPTHICF